MSIQSFATSRIFLLSLVLALAGCSGGSGGLSSPTAPAGPTASALSTQWGDVALQTNGYSFDADRALRSIEEGYAKGRRQIGMEVDDLRLAGYLITVMPADWGLNGQHVRESREIRVRAGVENVLEHELQHFFAWELGRFSECRTHQDHPGGYDLHCARL